MKVMLNHPAAKIPEYKTKGAAGADLYAVQDTVLLGQTSTVVRTGVLLEIPEGLEGQVRGRSSLASQGILVANSPGTIDSDYRGEIHVILYNTNRAEWQVKAGDRIAQLVIAPVVQLVFEETNEFTPTDRGTGGFGSTGK